MSATATYLIRWRTDTGLFGDSRPSAPYSGVKPSVGNRCRRIEATGRPANDHESSVRHECPTELRQRRLPQRERLRADHVRRNDLMLRTDRHAVGDEVQQGRGIDHVTSHRCYGSRRGARLMP